MNFRVGFGAGKGRWSLCNHRPATSPRNAGRVAFPRWSEFEDFAAQGGQHDCKMPEYRTNKRNLLVHLLGSP